MSQGRTERVAEEVKKSVGRIIHDELKDPRIGFVTITKVDLSRDLRFAKIYFSLLGSKKELADTKVGLERSNGFIRKLLGQRMKLRYVPQLMFKLDKSSEYSIRIAEVLEKIKDKGESNEQQLRGN
jgi:ribosome-binding factor A